MSKPRVTLKCPAAGYAMPDQRIVEFGDGTDGTGGLISFRRNRSGQLVVELYRLENVVVKAEG